MELEEVFGSFNRVKKECGDYYGEDGLLYCGKCQTRRETVLDIGKRKSIVPCICKCRRKKLDQYEIQEEYREKMRRVESLRNNSMMESRYKEAKFSSFIKTRENEKLYTVAKKYVEQFGKMLKDNQGLIFWGEVGTGKSYTAACIANALMDSMVTVIMTSFIEILQNLQNPQIDKAMYLRKFNEVNLLIIDDLGAERNTDYALEKVHNIIEGRYRSKMPLILTTNMTLDEMMESTDIRYERMYDRIFEMCFPVRAIGESWRKAEAAQRFDEMKKFMEV